MKATNATQRDSFHAPRRHGVACMWMLVVLAVITAMMATITAQILRNRRWLDQRANQLQTTWLARAGIELAAARLLNDPVNYTGESVELIPDSKVRIEVRREPNSTDTFSITSEARFPTENRTEVVRIATRQFRRTAEKERVHLEPVITNRPSS